MGALDYKDMSKSGQYNFKFKKFKRNIYQYLQCMSCIYSTKFKKCAISYFKK